jgi:hypothetical protein
MGGNIIAGLNPVNGTTGISKTQVATLVGWRCSNLHAILNTCGLCKCTLERCDMATIVAQGNIGSSVGAVLERLKQNIYSY